MSSWVEGGNEHFQEPINIECGINADPFDYETESVWMSLVVRVLYQQSAL